MKYVIDDFQSLDRLNEWDDKTQSVIKTRLQSEIGAFSAFGYLNEEEGEILKKIIFELLPAGNNIKLAETIDKSLGDKKSGVRYGENFWSGKFYKESLKIIKDERIEVNELVVSDILSRPEADLLYRFFRQVLKDAIAIYYSHPVSWDEIGFPGPAYPDGYPYLDCNEADDWEPKFKNLDQSHAK